MTSTKIADLYEGINPKLKETERKIFTHYRKKNFLSQRRRVFRSLWFKPQTRWQVSIRTGVPLQNLCRIIAQLRGKDAVRVTRVGTCPISGEQAEFLSTKPQGDTQC